MRSSSLLQPASILLLFLSSLRAQGAVQQRTQTPAEIAETCYDFLESHLCEGTKWGKSYHFYKPSTEKYTADQWLWDSGAHMITWSHKNVSNSILDLRTMLQMQLPNGKIPEEIFWQERNAMQEEELKLTWSTATNTDITQMPVLPFSLRAILDQAGSADERDKLLMEFLPPLVRYFKWFRHERDLGDGLVVILHGWESGLDASPAYDQAYSVNITDLSKVALAELYPRFEELVESYKARGWDMSKIMAGALPKSKSLDSQEGRQLGVTTTRFFLKDVAVNSVYAAGWKQLSDLAASSPALAPTYANDCLAEYKRSAQAIMEKMYDPAVGEFRALWIDGDRIERRSEANTVQNLFPLLLTDLPEDRMLALAAQLQDPNKFATSYMVPTVARDDAHFSATFPVDLMWRGPVWGFTNWFLIEGLVLHKQDALANAVLDKWIALCQKSGIWEHYNPLTGEPYGAVGLGMSTLIVDFLYRMKRL